MADGRLTGRNLALLLGLGLVWGTAFAFISLGLPFFPPVLFAALRFDIAGVVLLLVAFARRAQVWPRTRAQWAAIVIAAVFNVGGYHAFLFWGQQFTTAAVAAVLVGLNPILTTVASRWLLADERVDAAGIWGLALGFAGVVVLATLREGSILDATGIGEAVVVAAIASWAVGSTLVKRTRYQMDVFAFTAVHSLVGAGFLHLASLILEPGQHVVWNAESVGSLLYLALASSSAGFLVYYTLLERVGPIRANLVSHVAPVFAALAGLIAFNDVVELRTLVAFVLIAAGFRLVARPSR